MNKLATSYLAIALLYSGKLSGVYHIINYRFISSMTLLTAISLRSFAWGYLFDIGYICS
jgi:hypothetical protein